VFYINVPVAIAVLLITSLHVPETKDPNSKGRVDKLGAAAAVVFLAGLTYGLLEASSRGWTSPVVLAGLAIAAVTGPLFIVVERKVKDPMLPLSVFKSHQFSAANAVTFIVYGALSGALFLVPVELQLVVRYTALQSGLALLPITVIMLLLSPRSGRLATRIGPRLQMSLGPIVVGVGLVLLTQATHSGSYFTMVLPAMVVFGAGLTITVAPLTSTAMSAAPAEHAGIASAVNNAVARAAGLIAVTVLPLLAGLTGAAALQAHHFAAGFRTATVIAGCTCAAGGLLAAATIRNPSGGWHERAGSAGTTARPAL
jgi:uncharacterized membrane protein